MICTYCEPQKRSLSIIWEMHYWRVHLSPIQSYLGRCEVVAKKHFTDLSQVDMSTWIELSSVVSKLESALRQAFDATMFNWACLMNNAYREKPPNPHVHWHCIPRYDHTVKLRDEVFEDLEFGHHYNATMIEDDDKRLRQVTFHVRESIIKDIQVYLPPELVTGPRVL